MKPLTLRIVRLEDEDEHKAVGHRALGSVQGSTPWHTGFDAASGALGPASACKSCISILDGRETHILIDSPYLRGN